MVREASGYARRVPPTASDAWRFERLLARTGSIDPERAAAAHEEALAL